MEWIANLPAAEKRLLSERVQYTECDADHILLQQYLQVPYTLLHWNRWRPLSQQCFALLDSLFTN